MSDIRIDHGVVITMDPARSLFEDATVVIDKDRITAIGPTPDLAPRFPAATVIDASHHAVLPGLIDAHAHAGHSLIKSMGGESNDEWYQACDTVYSVASDGPFWRAASALASLERLKFGVTTGVSLLGGGNNVMRTDGTECAEAHIDAVLGLGVRNIVAMGPMLPPHPTRFRRWEGEVAVDVDISFEDQLEACATIVDRWHGSHRGRIGVMLLYPTVRPEHRRAATASMLGMMAKQAKQTRAVSRDRGVVFTQDGHTHGTVAFHHAIGLLGPDALLSHATDLSDEEIAICADTGTSIAHNPSAFASIYGRCPVPELLAAGANVAIGSDAPAPDRSNDMFRHMFQCLHYHRRHARDPAIMVPGQVLEMATINAAQAIGMASEIGSIEPGKKADIILIDLAKPHLAPMNMPLYRVVCFANGADVDTVIVDGRILMRRRELNGIDEASVLATADAAVGTMLGRTGFHAMLEARPDFFAPPNLPRRPST